MRLAAHSTPGREPLPDTIGPSKVLMDATSDLGKVIKSELFPDKPDGHT